MTDPAGQDQGQQAAPEGQDQHTQGDQGGQQGGQDQGQPEAKYSDKDLDKYKGSARKEGRQAATNELLQELGVESLDDLKTGYQTYAQQREAEKSEADKLRESYTTVEGERDQLQETLADIQIERALERRLLTEGVPAEGMDRVMRLVETGQVALDDDGNPETETLDTAISGVKETYPELFGGSTEQPRQRLSGPDANRETGVPKGQDAQVMDLRQQGKYLEAERLENQQKRQRKSQNTG